MRNNISKKKRRKKKYRLESSKDWIINYTGKSIVIDYSKWYGVDLICSIKELRMNGVEVNEEYEKKVKALIEAKKQARQLNKENRKSKEQGRQDEFSDERFAFIAGYTSNGVPFGITHEEMGEYSDDDPELF